ncbi:MAG: hypothetical protein ABSB39_05660 [Candidatus Sulfotelmatobacter sp.]
MSARLNFLAILVLVLIAFAVGNLGTFWGEARPNVAAMSTQSMASAGKAQSDVSSPAITASAVNGVVNPAAYPGSDIGEKINNVFAAGNGCAEVHIPAGKYVYGTTIRMFKPCQSLQGAGSALTSLEYTGSGDAIVWQMQPYTIQKAGILRGLTLKGPGTNVQNGIRSGTVIGATFEDLVINNFRGPNSTAILFENLMSPNLPTWTERTIIRDIHIGFPHVGNTTAMAFAMNGGGNSFGYTYISDVWLNVEKGQVGVRWGRGTYTYNSTLNFHANISALGTDSFVIDGIIRNSQLHLTGEAGCAKDLVHVGPEGQVQAEGIVAINCGSALTKGNFVRTDLAGIQVDNQQWDAFQLSPAYAPLINGKGALLMSNVDHRNEADLTNYYGPDAIDSPPGGFNFYNTFASIQAPNNDARALLAKIDAQGNWMTHGSARWGEGQAIPSSDNVALKTQLPLSGRTAGIGGALKAGSCARGVANVAGAVVGQIVPHPAATDGSLDSPLEIVSGAVTSANTITVQRCANASATLPAKTYNVRVIP